MGFLESTTGEIGGAFGKGIGEFSEKSGLSDIFNEFKTISIYVGIGIFIIIVLLILLAFYS